MTSTLALVILILTSSFAQNPVGPYAADLGTRVGLRPAKQKCWAGFLFGPCSVTNGGIAGGTFAYDFDGQTLRSNFTVMMTDIACFDDGGGLAYGMAFYQPSWEYRIVKDGTWFGLGSKVIYDNVIPANLAECSYDSSMKAFQSVAVPMQILPIQISESGSYRFQIQAQLCCNDALHGLGGLYRYRYWTDWSYSYSFHLEATSSPAPAAHTTAFSTKTFTPFPVLRSSARVPLGGPALSADNLTVFSTPQRMGISSDQSENKTWLLAPNSRAAPEFVAFVSNSSGERRRWT